MDQLPDAPAGACPAMGPCHTQTEDLMLVKRMRTACSNILQCVGHFSQALRRRATALMFWGVGDVRRSVDGRIVGWWQ